MSESDDASRHSYSTGGTSGAGSDGASSQNSDAAALNALQDRTDADESLNDLLDSSRKLDEGVFATIALLNKRTGTIDVRWVVLRVVLEFLQLFRVVFNTTMVGWSIDSDSWAFKAIQWVLIRGLVMPKGYDTYIRVFYAIAAIILISLACSAWLAVALKRDDANDSSWTGKLIRFLQLLCYVIYSLAWISILNYLAFLFSCKWTAVPSGLAGVKHVTFDVACLAPPHVAHMAFACFIVIVFCAAVLAMSVGDCDLNPMTRNVLATPSATTHIKVILCKMVLVILVTCADENPKLQAIATLLLLVYIWVTLVLAAGYYGEAALYGWSGLVLGIVYTAAVMVISVFWGHGNEARAIMLTRRAVLFGIWPAVAAGAGIAVLRVRYVRRPLPRLREAFADAAADVVDYKSVFRFRDQMQAELLLRAMRKWDEDGVPDADAAAFGDFIMKCALARFPGSPSLLVTAANVQLIARKDGQAARTSLQLAVKSSPSLVERYFIFVTQDAVKRLKNEGGGLDLMGYIEFQRNYRACVHSHKAALAAQRALWLALLHDTIQFKSLQRAFVNMNAAEARAAQVYRKVLERYPTNGRLLKAYGRFLEFCRNDPWTANRYYLEAMKQGTGESLMALVAGGGGGAEGADAAGAGVAALGSVDDREDGVIIINASGIIMATNKALHTMFGYEKGELEQKNVSCLMPQPFSSRHNGYLARYSQTGEARILNSTRAVVGLTKLHAVFPISLTVTKLSGLREDAVFMGVVRHAPHDDDGSVRLWVAPGSGIVLTADEAFADAFGFHAPELVGRPLTSLGPDVDVLEKLVADGSLLDAAELHAGRVCARTRLLHRFLPPVDVDVQVDLGGTATERVLMLAVKCVVPPGILMVVDHKGRIVHATTGLGTLLGFPLRQLVGMELASLIPPPYSQLHAGFYKNLSATAPPNSCRAGAVVHLLRANGVRLPVTLAMSSHDDGDRVSHVVRVTPSSEAARLDRQRMVLSVGEQGTVLAVNSGANRALFNVVPAALVGRPLSAFLNVFRELKASGGDDVTLLAALGGRALEGGASAGDAWRVGVSLPQAGDGGNNDEGDEGGAPSSALAAMLQSRNRERPAIMNVAVRLEDDHDDAAAPAAAAADPANSSSGSGGGGDPASAAASERTAIELTLWRADALTAVVEVDAHLEVARADPAAGLLFGVHRSTLIKADFRRVAGLPADTQFTDLLAAPRAAKSGASAGKKSGLKGGGAPKTGARRVLRARHADGSPLELEMQAVTKPGSSNHLVIRLQLLQPSCGSLAPLMALLGEGGAAADVGQAQQPLMLGADATGDGAQAARMRGSPVLELGSHGVDGSDGGRSSPPGHGGAADKGGSPGRTPRHCRIAEWVRQTGGEAGAAGGGRGGDEGDSGDSDGGAPQHRRGVARSNAHAAKHGSKSFKESSSKRHPDESPAPRGKVRVRSQHGSDDDGDGDDHNNSEGGGGKRSEDEAESGGQANGMYGRGAPAAGYNFGAAGAGASSIGGSSIQSGGTDAQDAASSAVTDTAGGEDAELSADFRRAKRLKKLSRLFTCSTAQSATLRLRQRTWLLTFVILGAHLTAFAVLVTQIESRYANAHGTAMMARAADLFQLSVMRANMLQRCGIPDFAAWAVCNNASYEYNMGRLAYNIPRMQAWHQALYLGDEGKLKPFADGRLYEYWTKHPLPETLWVDMGNGQFEKQHRNETLWVMGNKQVTAAADVHFHAASLRNKLNETAPWNYLFSNGPTSVFTGYAWSLDTFVDYAWASLGKLKTVLIVLLVVETLCVQLACMTMLTLLVRTANAQHMRRFSVFLALPSATLRVMATRQLMVDDDMAGADDDEELEGLDAGGGGGGDAGGTTTAGGGGGGGDKKSVRMADDVDGGGDAPSGAAKSKKDGAKSKKDGGPASLLAASKKAAAKRKLSARIARTLFGWLDMKVKVNGKKLIPNSAVLLRFMGPLLLWAIAVVVVFGVSFGELSNLQGPLSSLNAAGHVTYRVSRVRLMGNFLAFAETNAENDVHRANLLSELSLLRSEYNALLYGGRIDPVNPDVKFESVAPPATFASAEFSNLFFTTRECLREDPSGCAVAGSPYYDITHAGLDAMVTRWMDTYTAFAMLPNEIVYANHTLYKFINDVGGRDMVQGLDKATDLFETYTIQRFEAVKTLHIILLVVSLAIIAGFVVFLFRPYVRLLHEESKDIAGLLSQLPAEVAIEDIARTVVIGAPPRADGATTLAPGAAAAMPFFGAGAKSTAGSGALVPAGAGYGGGAGGYMFAPGFGGSGMLPPNMAGGADGAVALHVVPGMRGSGGWGSPPGGYGGGMMA